jgi:hypothetical protein
MVVSVQSQSTRCNVCHHHHHLEQVVQVQVSVAKVSAAKALHHLLLQDIGCCFSLDCSHSVRIGHPCFLPYHTGIRADFPGQHNQDPSFPSIRPVCSARFSYRSLKPALCLLGCPLFHCTTCRRPSALWLHGPLPGSRQDNQSHLCLFGTKNWSASFDPLWPLPKLPRCSQ